MGRMEPLDGQAKEPEAISRVAPEAGLLLGAGRAILLQLAHPQIGRAIAEHSDFAANPLSRLIHTLSYIYALSNGTAEQQRKIIAYVDAAHQPIRGTRDEEEGQPAYSALDPKLQLWVAATLYDSSRVVASQILDEKLEDQEELYQQYARLGDALQMPSGWWPANFQEFSRYFSQMEQSLQATDQARDLARELFLGRNAPWWIRIGLPMMRDVTIAQLPASVREEFGYVLTPKVQKRNARIVRLVRVATKCLPKIIRYAPMRLMLRHIDRMA